MAAAADSGRSPGAVRLPTSPPFKVLAEQLRRDAEGGPGAWRLSRAAGRRPLELAAVWMQGTVVAAGGDGARLRDPSGAFSVRGLERVPRGRPCLVPGDRHGHPGSHLTPLLGSQLTLGRGAVQGLAAMETRYIRPAGETAREHVSRKILDPGGATM
ncbi:recQ-mediated genome instability protein 2 [Marmota marmota marmota]|uniref:recQ-mediated genome instability protein 2 n=1 Tax=Marmota marmota marmota TaxID=9994 RepID=UPI00209400AE|nr:recQ-mediated genome instability protein 2 [Marmota marmota marmota]